MDKSKRIHFTPSDQVKLYLEQLKRIGIYGKRRGDVINHFLGEKIEELLEKKILKRLSPELEGSGEEDDDEG